MKSSSNFKNRSEWHSAPFSLLTLCGKHITPSCESGSDNQVRHSFACCLSLVLSLVINTMYLQCELAGTNYINLHPLEVTGPLADKTCQETSLCTEMKDVGLLMKNLPCLEIFLSLIWTFEGFHLFIFQSQKVRLYFLMKSGSVSHVKAMYQLCQKPQCFSNSTIWACAVPVLLSRLGLIEFSQANDSILKTVPIANKTTPNCNRSNLRYDVIPDEPDLTFNMIAKFVMESHIWTASHGWTVKDTFPFSVNEYNVLKNASVICSMGSRIFLSSSL